MRKTATSLVITFIFLAGLTAFASQNPIDPDLSSNLPSKGQSAEKDAYYQPVDWVGRNMITPKEAINGFWPESKRPGSINYDFQGLDMSRLPQVPAAGVHPRVYLTEQDAEVIRKKIAMGDDAPQGFLNLWNRFKSMRSRSALYAYLTQDDELGKELAKEFMEKMPQYEAAINAFEKYSDKDDFNSVRKTMTGSGDAAAKANVAELIAYDYLYQWLDDSQRSTARKVISKATTNRLTNFTTIPDHFVINNHHGFATEFIALILQIEGEEGFDEEIYKLTEQKVQGLLDYYLNENGMCYETIKGWLPMNNLMPIFRRNPHLLQHSHLHAKMDFYLKWTRFEDGKWVLRDEMRNSTFHVVWMMHYLFPDVKNYDFLHSATYTSFRILYDPESRWSYPVGTNWENMLLTAQAVSDVDYTDPKVVDALKNETYWTDPLRGYMAVRNSWKPGDMYLDMAGKQDLLYGGHEGTEHGRWAMWANGINWVYDTDMLFNKDAQTQNMVAVDGQSIKWPPVSSVWLGSEDNDHAAWAAVDYKDGYIYTKRLRHPLDNASTLGNAYWSKGWSNGEYTRTRDSQMQFHQTGIDYHDGYAHTDYGAWNNEQRLLEDYTPFNAMAQAYRSIVLAKGKYPYAMVIDDVKQDDQQRYYAWNMTLQPDMTLINDLHQNPADPAVTHPKNDMYIGLADTPRRPNRTAKWHPLYSNPNKKDNVCLVRVFDRNYQSITQVPAVTRFKTHNVLTVHAIADQARFKVMVYPYIYPATMPVTKWNKEKTQFTVKFSDDMIDIWHFGLTDGGRTAFALERNSKIVQSSNVGPQRPHIIVNNTKFDPDAKRNRQDAGVIPEYTFIDSTEAVFDKPQFPAVIKYTLDGTNPDENSPTYDAAIKIENTATLKAAVYSSQWKMGPKIGNVTTAEFVKTAPAKAVAAKKTTPGIRARVYEITTRIWDNEGYFRADKIMLPNLDSHTPLLDGIAESLYLPAAMPGKSQLKQAKGFYRFNGYLEVPETGVYDFSIYSNGPARLTIANQTAINHIGIFHQNIDHRSGQAALEKGLQEFELIVTDPLFWKIDVDGKMPFNAAMKTSLTGKEVEMKFQTNSSPRLSAVKAEFPTPVIKPVKLDFRLQRGIKKMSYDRTGKNILWFLPGKELFDVEKDSPQAVEFVEKLIPNDSLISICVYDGYFYAPEDGVYEFITPGRKDNHQVYANQVQLGKNVITQHGVAGRYPSGKAMLTKGYYPIKIKLGISSSDLTIKYPNGTSVKTGAKDLYRPASPAISPQGLNKNELIYEIHEETKFEIELTRDNKDLQIRYTLNAKEPTPTSPVYDQPIAINASTTINAAGFKGKTKVTENTTCQINRVEYPMLGEMINLNFKKIDPDSRHIPAEFTAGASGYAAHDALITDTGMKTTKGPKDKGAPGIGFNVVDLKFKRSEMTVAMKFKLDDLNGKLFGKWGYGATGKGYKTVRAELHNGRVRVFTHPSRMLPRTTLKTGQWYHIVFTGSPEQTALYLDGKQIAKSSGTPTLMVPDLDMLIRTPATVSDFRVYDRPLSEDEVLKLYEHIEAKDL